jgi:hypothetical protein
MSSTVAGGPTVERAGPDGNFQNYNGSRRGRKRVTSGQSGWCYFAGRERSYSNTKYRIDEARFDGEHLEAMRSTNRSMLVWRVRAMSFKPLQSARSKVTMVLRPLIDTDRETTTGLNSASDCTR